MDNTLQENRLLSWKSIHEGGGMVTSQKLVNEREASVKLYKSFQLSIIPALLQSPKYAEWIIANVEPDLSPSRHLAKFVEGRIRRQAIMENPNKYFQFVLYEPVLRRVLPGEIMSEQIEYLRNVVRRENISVGIIPLDSPEPIIPINNFAIFDDKLVTSVTVAHRMEVEGADEVRMYLRNFEQLKKAAVWHEELEEFLNQLDER